MRIFATALVLTIGSAPALAQTGQPSPPVAAVPAPGRLVARTRDDLPRFAYPVPGTAAALLDADDATFNAWAARVVANGDATLARYEIGDRAVVRQLLGLRLDYQILTGQNQAALVTGDAIRALQDKPDARLMSGIPLTSVLHARVATGQTGGPAFDKAFADDLTARLKALPWVVVANRVKENRSNFQLVSHDLALGFVAQQIEPAVARAHSVDQEMAADLVYWRTLVRTVLPVRAAALAAFNAEVAANNVEKPDIWAARDVVLTARDRLTPVVVGVWDSGSDLKLFPAQTFTDPHPRAALPYNAHGLAFDVKSRPSTGPLYPLSPGQAAAYPAMLADIRGFSDLQSAIDSPAADALKKKIAALPAAQVPAYFEQLKFYDQYVHGTHVAGIIARGNPAARLAVARLTFDYRNVPEPPSDALQAALVASYRAYVDWFRDHGVRVVNMSWGGRPSDYENALQLNGVGKDAAERKALARHYFDMDRDGLLAALRSAPDILFVCAAGNNNADSGFGEFIPAEFDLPNLLVVGAVDRAGDEASFTSYGKTVAVHANGYQVTSMAPGGSPLAMSGTSMASPTVANLAAKLFALRPSLTPAEVRALIVRGATTTPDGRRHNIDPRASVALLTQGRTQPAAP